MALDKVILMIRGDKDTVVRLQLMPVGSTNPSEYSVVELVRDEIKLKDGEAHAELIEWAVPDAPPLKIGYIELPSFYRDMTQNGNNPEAKSTTRDVLALLKRLKAEGIDGLVMDFRRDGGGSLEEAINLSGLFFKEGPVVQIKNWNGEITVSKDTDPSIAYDGPMVVLVNRQSASASEIFAAAMQDYGRAVIVGDSKTFGKGTVQQLLELNRVVPLLAKEPRAGAVKLTIQKFYRVAGGSTQLRGVERPAGDRGGRSQGTATLRHHQGPGHQQVAQAVAHRGVEAARRKARGEQPGVRLRCGRPQKGSEVSGRKQAVHQRVRAVVRGGRGQGAPGKTGGGAG
jgi:carboxyl-terminal processing protease